MDWFKVKTSRTDVHFCEREAALQRMKAWCDGGRTLVVTSEGTIRRLGLEVWVKSICSCGGMLLTDVPSNPNVAIVSRALKAVDGFAFERVIAIGGGSAIDLAKAVCALKPSVSEGTYDEVERIISEKNYIQRPSVCSIMAVPTTAGTGSEVTQWATVWDTRRKKKYSLDMPSLCPQEAVIVPEFTLTMGHRLTISTGLDALSHAMEAFWSKARNPVSQALALDAVRRIHRTLPDVVKDPQNTCLRKEMCIASLLAGEAFAMTRTTACHSISYPLTLLYGVPHGLAAAALMPQVAERNQEAVPEIWRMLDIFGGTVGFDAWLKQMLTEAEFTLGQYGVNETQVSIIAEQAFTLGRMDNNPVNFNRDDVGKMLTNIL